MTELDAEDSKIVTLARAARVRLGAAQGAAIRDADGRTYAAATVTLPSLQLSALQVAVAMAVSSGARGLEAASVVSDGAPTQADLDAVRDLGGAGTPVFVMAPDGTLRERLTV